MSTSAAAPATLSGLNGFDFASLITLTIQSDSAPMQAMQAQQTALQAKDSALSQLGTQLTQYGNDSLNAVEPDVIHELSAHLRATAPSQTQQSARTALPANMT